ncbi:TBC1D4 isoform 5 [Pongo abelii]|uniref:TBC1 domain family member 4 n=1 Tax=Pongo abelii TaxID=9601 RepID=A0A2J8WU17_PONAB|nr:TBC1D4 isoform 5 [Pongo abelii]
MEPPSCIQDEPFPHPLEPEPGVSAQPGPGKPSDKRFRLWYVGGSCLDHRTTLPMLPWLMAEIRRRSQKPEAGGCGAPAAREVILVLSAPFLRCVPAPGAGASGGTSPSATQPNPAVFIFEHKAQHISRFIHNSHDLTYFAYLIKAQPDDPESQMACHVFRATDPSQVPDVISSIRQLSKAAMKEDAKPSKDNEDAFYNSQKFEVLYCGKVTVTHKKAPSSLIDDCMEKFSLHEQQRLKIQGEQRSPDPGEDLADLEVVVPGSPGDCLPEEADGTDTHLGLPAGASQPALTSSRVCFPERILEDSGFDEQQEFRSRCSSVTGVQRRVHEGSQKSQPRRRHASAPSHVQPSDSEKNRTMLFQVDEVMLTLKQAFSTAAALQSAKTQIKLCEACPMHSLHKLCERIEGLYPPRAKLVIQRHLSSLTDNEQADIFERVQKMKPISDQEENELVILHLRQLCEAKQKTHVHIGEGPSTISNSSIPENATSSGRFKLDILKNKAKRSLTSSLENIFSRGANRMRGRLGSVDSFERSNSLASEKDYSPGDSPPGTPPASPLSSAWQTFPEEDSDSPQFRRRAHTFSHPPSSTKRKLNLQDGRAQGVRSPLLRQSSSEQCSDGEGRKRTSSTCSNESLSVGGTSVTPRRISWRQRIFLRVASPMNKSPSAMQQQASRDELQSRKVKLDYEEVGACQKEVLITWDKKLLNCRAKIRCDMEDIHTLLKEGVPKSRRGEIWQFLALQYRLRHRLPNKQQPPDISYKELLKQLTAQQHAILVDLGRTFPTHPYFSVQLGPGQLSLFNLLKAYSLLDKEVGYCQGISFVAGVLLLHMSEEQAFEMLKFLMYDLGFRKQYRPDMMSLQIQMYQLSRLLHDYHRDLYNHLEENEISPSLYAAPWFLTLFASQFSLGFVARVFDIIFLQGTEVIFKVALSLLSSQETLIMECESFENIVEFLKNTLPDMNTSEMEKIITQVFEMDISKQLHAYEVEYHVLQDELQEYSYSCEDSEPLEKLERANSQLKRQNMDLLEKLQVAHAKIQALESNLENLLTRETKMKSLIRTLEQEKIAYQKTVEQLRKLLPADALANCELLLRDLNCNPNNKAKIGNKP